MCFVFIGILSIFLQNNFSASFFSPFFSFQKYWLQVSNLEFILYHQIQDLWSLTKIICTMINSDCV